MDRNKLAELAKAYITTSGKKRFYIFKEIEPFLSSLQIRNLFKDDGTYNTYDGSLSAEQKLFICQQLAEGHFTFEMPLCPACKKLLRRDPFKEDSICSSKSQTCNTWLMRHKNQQLKTKQDSYSRVRVAASRILDTEDIETIAKKRLSDDKGGYYSAAIALAIENGTLHIENLPENWKSMKRLVTEWVAKRIVENQPLTWPTCKNCGKLLKNPLGTFCSAYCSNTYKAKVRKQLKDKQLASYTTETHFENILKHNNIRYQRQVKIGQYIVDFLLPDFNMIVEIDGIQHYMYHSGFKDLSKTEFLNKQGFKVVRIPFYIPLEQRFLDAYFDQPKLKAIMDNIDWLGFKYITQDVWLCGSNAINFVKTLQFLTSKGLTRDVNTILQTAFQHKHVILDSIFYEVDSPLKNLSVIESKLSKIFG